MGTLEISIKNKITRLEMSIKELSIETNSSNSRKILAFEHLILGYYELLNNLKPKPNTHEK